MRKSKQSELSFMTNNELLITNDYDGFDNFILSVLNFYFLIIPYF